jgi:hypothetical protein
VLAIPRRFEQFSSRGAPVNRLAFSALAGCCDFSTRDGG